MNFGGTGRFFYSSSTFTYAYLDDHSALQPHAKTVEVPIVVSASEPSAPVTFTDSQSQDPPPPPSAAAIAATKIQAAYRSYVVRSLVKKIQSVNSEANRIQCLIQRQETVDAVRTNEREKIKINEALMKLLLTLDSVPGADPAVRELRRHVSHRIVGLQEIVDSVSDARVEGWDAFLREWDDVIAGIEVEICRERGGGHELERFCAENLGFRCLQRFLREQ